MSGLTINFSNSEVMVLGYSKADRQSIADRLNCRLGSFPTSYPRIPISDSRLSMADLWPCVTKLQHRVETWQGRWFFKVAWMMLINSSLSSLLLFIMSFYSLHEILHHEIEKFQSKFSWTGEGQAEIPHGPVDWYILETRSGRSWDHVIQMFEHCPPYQVAGALRITKVYVGSILSARTILWANYLWHSTNAREDPNSGNT